MEQKSDASERGGESKPASKTKDTWDKADIIFRSVGAFATAAVVAVVGIFGSSFLAKRQERETNLRLYTEVMSRREEANTALRREMLLPVFTAVAKEPVLPEKTILSLELLAYNFHDSMDLEPLFRDLYRQLEGNREQNGPHIERVLQVRRNVIGKQVAMLTESGGKRDFGFEFNRLANQPSGLTVLDDSITLKRGPDEPPSQKHVKIDVFSTDMRKRELRVRLMVHSAPDVTDVDTVLTVSLFDFPMVDYVRIGDAYRCAIVLNTFEDEHADLTFVYFPGSRGSLNETEILYDLRKP